MHETIEQYFDNLNPICYLSEQSKGVVLKNSDLVELKRGKYLFKRGDVDNKSYFLLDGTVELRSPKNTFMVQTGTDTANYALAQFQPRQYSAYVKKNAVFLKVDKKLLDSLAEKDGIYNLDRPTGMVLSEDDVESDIDWMSQILKSDLFSKLPPSNIQKIFSRIEPIEVKKGEIIVRQEDPGDYFYIIEVGKAEVVQKVSKSTAPIKLESLSIGDYFGEEALISECPRNATVIMLSDGDLMRLPKQDFIELIRDPILRSYRLDEIEEIHKTGAQWIDVRFPEELLEYNSIDKLDIPLHVIRKQIEELDKSKKYIVFCDDGNKSAVASFLLSLKGIDAAFLEGGLINWKNQEENGFDLSFLYDRNDSNKDSKVIDFIPRHASKTKQLPIDEVDDGDITQELPAVESQETDTLEAQRKLLEEQLETEKLQSQEKTHKKLNEAAKKKKTEDEKELVAEIEKQKKEIEKQLAEESARQKKEIEKQLVEEISKQKKEIEKQLAEEAKKEKKELEKQLAEERTKLKAEAEKKLAEEAAKQKKELEKQLLEEAKKEKQAIEKQLAEERAKQKAAVEKQLADEAAKQKKEIEKQLAEELKNEKRAVEKQLAEERAKQKAEVEKQLASEAAKQKKEIEKQLLEEAKKEKKAIEKQLAEEKARQKAAAEKRIAEEKIRQKKLIELQLIEERAKQKAAVEKQLEEERARQKAEVEKQLAEEVNKQKKAIEEQMQKEAEKKKNELEQQLAKEAERRKKAIEEKLAEQETKQKALIDDIILTGKTKSDEQDKLKNSDSINKLINQYRVEQEKVKEEILDQSQNRTSNELSRIKELKEKKEKEHQDLKKLKQKVADSLSSKSKQTKSKEMDKKVVADKHKVLSKRYNILNDPRFREHINKLNVQKEKQFLEEIKSFKKELDIDDSGGHSIEEHIGAADTQNLNKQPKEINLENKSDKTIESDIESWIQEQELLEHSPKRMKLIEEKKKLMKELQKQYLEDKKIDKIRNQTLLTEIKSALEQESDK